MATILAADVSDKVVSIILTCLMLMGAFLVLGVGIWYIRHWQRGASRDEAAPWTFDDLRKLREEGKLTEAEYQALRAEMIGMYTRQSHPEASATSSLGKENRKGDQEWDWVADNDPESGGFDVKKESPD